MSWSQTMRLILVPQAITAMLPVLVSQLVVVLKDTAIGYQITFVEMVRQGTNIGSAYGNYAARADRDRHLDDHGELHAVLVRDVAGTAAAPVQTRAGAAGGRGHRTRRCPGAQVLQAQRD